MLHANGKWVWLRARCELVRQPDEPGLHLIGIAVDVTEQKTLVERTAAADIRLRDAIETIPEAFVLWDHENRLVLCNSNFQNLHNLPDEAIVAGTPYEDVVAAGRKHVIRSKLASEDPADSRRAHLRGAARRRPLAADQRAPHQGRRLRLGRHRHHPAQAAREQADRQRAAADGDRHRPAQVAAEARNPGPAAHRAGAEIRRGEDPRRGGQPDQVEVPRQHEPRAAHAAQRHHRLLRDHGIRNVRRARLRQVSRVLPRHPPAAGNTCSTSSTTSSTCRRSRPAGSSSTWRTSSSTASSPTRCASSPRARRTKRLKVTSKIASRHPLQGRPARAQADRAQPSVQRRQVHARERPHHGARPRCRAARWSSASRIPASASRATRCKKLGRPFEQVESQLTKTHHGSGLGLAIAKSLVELHGGAMRIRSTLGRRHHRGGAPAARRPAGRSARPTKRRGRVTLGRVSEDRRPCRQRAPICFRACRHSAAACGASRLRMRARPP